MKTPPLFILLLLVSFASISAVLFTPALPEITHKLGITISDAQLTMSLFLIGYALGNLPYAPLSNRFGRKPALFFGISLAIFASLLILIAGAFQLFWLFVLARFLTALGSASGLKVVFTMIGDLYQHEKATKRISYCMLAFSIGPGLAIALGGFLTKQFGWESCFYFLILYSIFLLILTFYLPETCKELDLDALQIKKIATGYLTKLKNKKLVTCALLIGCGTAFAYLFASLAPFIGIKLIGLSPDAYGLLYFIPSSGMIIGALLSLNLAGKANPFFLIRIGILIALLSATVMFFLFLFNIITPLSLFLPMPFIFIGLSFIFANASSLALTHAKNKSNASAMMHFINIGMSVLTLFFAELFPFHQAFILPLFFIGIAVILLFLRRRLVHLLVPTESN